MRTHHPLTFAFTFTLGCASGIPATPSTEADDDDDACGPGQLTCNNGLCLSTSALCDGRNDCPDGVDESRCGDPAATPDAGAPDAATPCGAGMIQCSDGACVSGGSICNGFEECSDGLDEVACPSAAPTCTDYEFACEQGPCVLILSVCDGRVDCPRQDDERWCFGWSWTDWFDGGSGGGGSCQCDTTWGCDRCYCEPPNECDGGSGGGGYGCSCDTTWGCDGCSCEPPNECDNGSGGGYGCACDLTWGCDDCWCEPQEECW